MEYFISTVVLLGVFIILLCVGVSSSAKKIKRSVKATDLMSVGQSYAPKNFLTTRERECFQQLRQAVCPERFLICPQVRLVDVVSIAPQYFERSPEWTALFRQISQWHCDFVIVDMTTFAVCAVVELDDRSHQRTDRRRRDAIFNEVISQAGLRLYRITSATELLRNAAWLKAQ